MSRNMSSTWSKCWLHLRYLRLLHGWFLLFWCMKLRGEPPRPSVSQQTPSELLAVAAGGCWSAPMEIDSPWSDCHWLNRISGNKVIACLRVFFDPNFFFFVILLGINLDHTSIKIYIYIWALINIEYTCEILWDPVRLLQRNWTGQGRSWQLSPQQTGRVLNLSLNVSLVWAVLTGSSRCPPISTVCVDACLRRSLSILFMTMYSMNLFFFISVVLLSLRGAEWFLRQVATGFPWQLMSQRSRSFVGVLIWILLLLDTHQNSVIFYDVLRPPLVWQHNNQVIAANNSTYTYIYLYIYICMYVCMYVCMNLCMYVCM